MTMKLDEKEPLSGVKHAEEVSQWILRSAVEQRNSRFMVAIAGAPAAGKSTFAINLVNAINQASEQRRAVHVPMDGFHKTAAVLAREGATDSKGKPDTFEVERLLDFLNRLRRFEKHLRAPQYSRETHDVVDDAYQVDDEDIAIVEGNYLLCDRGLWTDIGRLFDVKIFLSVSQETAVRRLHQRYGDSGRSAQWQEKHIADVDLPNLRLIEDSKGVADCVIQND